MIIWIMIVIFGVLSIVFFMGKGAFLIAGYNTAKVEDKLKYDEKKLCRVIGVGCLIVTISLLLAQLFEEMAVYFCSIGILLGVIVMFVGTSFFCNNKGEKNNDRTGKKGILKSKGFWSGLFTVGVCLFVGVTLFTGHVKVEFYDQYLSVGSDSWATKTIEVDYENIENIEYVSDIELGKRTFGVGSAVLNAGHFKNKTYGDYNLYAYTSCKEYIVLHTESGIVVFNDKDEAKTKSLYQQIEDKLKK